MKKDPRTKSWIQNTPPDQAGIQQRIFKANNNLMCTVTLCSGTCLTWFEELQSYMDINISYMDISKMIG